MKLTPHVIGAATVLVLAGGLAQAQDNIFKAGITRYDTHSESSGLSVSPPALPPGDAVTGDATTVVFIFERTLTPNLGVELVLGIPPKIEATATGALGDALAAGPYGKDILSAKNVSPTLLFNYYFGAPGDTWRPYLSAGLNYTYFMDVESPLPTTKLEMSDSWGLALGAGVNYAVDKNWGMFASVTRIDTESDIEAVVAPNALGPGSPPITVKTTVDFKPWTYTAGVFYRF